ncbi:MAG: hypothetical protein IPL71_16480 [Anaerolineales bacterium]|uniref:hypothetical protein n=1 Tax=Candidatus Villigracilis proximus TaxID=3140683 RepID=UPI003134C251|nr:hypothetical protein [Anaerolineales bacterium]
MTRSAPCYESDLSALAPALAQPALIEFPGGSSLHSAAKSRPLSSAQNSEAAGTGADMPIIVNLMADRPEETMRM